MHSSITAERICEAVEEGDNVGFCVACGAEAYNIEPDARKYHCEACALPAVYGAEELLLRLPLSMFKEAQKP